MDGILRAPAAVVVGTGVPMSTAVARLAEALADRPRIEPTTSSSSDRRLIGHVEGNAVRLSVWDANVLSRRKSWNVQFLGAFETAASGAILTGAIDIPDRKQLAALIWMFRIASVFTAILALAIDVRDLAVGRAVVLVPAIGAIAIAVFAVVATRRMETEGGRRAEDDARVLTAAVDRLLNG